MLSSPKIAALCSFFLGSVQIILLLSINNIFTYSTALQYLRKVNFDWNFIVPTAKYIYGSLLRRHHFIDHGSDRLDNEEDSEI
ncbi:uncharacterized protein C8R40DRAFT_1112945 [Lentinula edodes]|uniref:uncharacterized protein n=1 Tax=Lentinula edodes TaxID=5353 RepID=UPI001E8EF3E4|nr:uncharacterized protein C8R40DRAFT_1112945 [Lentinula edodes]KAH7873646.1 hypothetical protein C8R40DRAFT_1112945 [Lentinula edodes]